MTKKFYKKEKPSWIYSGKTNLVEDLEKIINKKDYDDNFF